MEPQPDLNIDIQDLPQPRMVNSLVRKRQQGAFYSAEELLKRFSPFERLSLYVFTILLGLSSMFLLSELNPR